MDSYISAHRQNLENLVGKRFGKLLVLADGNGLVCKDFRRARKWICACDCGGFVLYTTGRLNGKTATSCGCGHKPVSERAPRKRGPKEDKFKSIGTDPFNFLFGRKA